MAAKRAGRGWLAAAAVLLAGTSVFAFLQYFSYDSATAEQDQAEQTLADAGDRIGSVGADLTEATSEHADAVAALAAGESSLAGAVDSVEEAAAALDEIAAKRSEAASSGPELAEAAALYPEPAADVIAAVELHLASSREMAEIRQEQAAALEVEDYRTFNRLQGEYNGIVDAHNQQANAVSAAVNALPRFGFGDISSHASLSMTAPHLTTVEEDLDPPTGPARLVGSFLDSIPCTHRSEGCRWSWEITFEETNALRVRIDRLAIRYTDRRGSVWVSQSGEWRNVDIVIQPLGTGSYDNWVQSLDPDSDGNLQGATLAVRWEGVDSEGNSITGRATVYLEWRKDA